MLPVGGQNDAFLNRLTNSMTATAGPDFARPLVGRGLAIWDYDNDGKMDVLVADSEGGPLLLHNDATASGHWLELKLTGT